jgi:hypothetical protein
MVSSMSSSRPTQRVRAVTSQDLCAQKFEKRAFPARSMITNPMDRGRVLVIQSPEYSGWACLKPQRPLRRTRTICDFSAHMKFCHDESLESSDQTEANSALLTSDFDNEWRMTRSATVSDLPSHRKICDDIDNTKMRCPFFERSATDKFENISFINENTQNFSSLQAAIETSLREEFKFLRVNDTPSHLSKKQSSISAIQLTSNDPSVK